MAQRVQIQLLDDIAGEEAAETITFGLDGVVYKIDLTAQNAHQLRDELGAMWKRDEKPAGGQAFSGNLRRHPHGIRETRASCWPGSCSQTRCCVVCPARTRASPLFEPEAQRSSRSDSEG